jgi:hypothetical protein
MTNMLVYPKRQLINNVYETMVNDMNHLNDLLSDKLLDIKNNYVYRGHQRSDWTLKPTLFRKSIDYDSFYEDKLINLFRKNILGRRGKNPRTLNTEELFSLGQHFGMRTPLLDWSSSIYVALFFAFAEDIANPTPTRVIYGLNRLRIETYDPTATVETLRFIEPLVDENKRLINQSGVFTFSLKDIEIEDWIKNLNYPQKNKILLLKIHIDNNCRESMLKQLNWMNINYLTLFPDLLGAALHTNLQTEIKGY